MTNTISDSLLESFDTIIAGGDTLPLDELKTRYRDGDYFSIYRRSKIYTTVLTLPVDIADLLDGTANAAVKQVIDGIREVRGDVVVEHVGDGESVTVTVLEWRDEKALRSAWREFAEHEYKAENLGGVS